MTKATPTSLHTPHTKPRLAEMASSYADRFAGQEGNGPGASGSWEHGAIYEEEEEG